MEKHKTCVKLYIQAIILCTILVLWAPAHGQGDPSSLLKRIKIATIGAPNVITIADWYSEWLDYEVSEQGTVDKALADSWGITNFDEIECEIFFQPSVRRLTIEDIQRLPLDAVSPKEKREILKALHVPLDDSEFDELTKSGEQDDCCSTSKWGDKFNDSDRHQCKWRW